MGTSESKKDTAQTGENVETVSPEVVNEPVTETAIPHTEIVSASDSQKEETKEEAHDRGKAQSENVVSSEAAADVEVNERRALCMRACAVEIATGNLSTTPQRVIPVGPPVEPSLIVSTPSNEYKTKTDVPEAILSTPGAVTGSDAGLIGKPVTLTELFSGQSPNAISSFSPGTYSHPAANFPYWSPQAEFAGDYHAGELWANSSWYDYNASPTVDWNGIHQESSFGYPEYHQWMPTSPPRPISSLTPVVTEPVTGLDRDSPRSVVLTLCGAWGALKTQPSRLSKTELLSFRHAMPRGSRPKPLRSLRTVGMQSYAY